jgi:hypothetical protein
MASITGGGSGSRIYHIAGAATTQVVTGKGVLRKIVVNTPIASSTIKLIDNTSGSTVNIGTITNTSAVEPYELCYDIKFRTGLRIITSGADDITVVYD